MNTSAVFNNGQVGPSSAAATVTSVAASVTAVTLLPASSGRRGIILFNNSASVSYIKFGAAATAADFTTRLPGNSPYEFPFPLPSNIITAIWESAVGNMQITVLV